MGFQTMQSQQIIHMFSYMEISKKIILVTTLFFKRFRQTQLLSPS